MSADLEHKNRLAIRRGDERAAIHETNLIPPDLLANQPDLPSLLHQDHRYFYQGTGTTGSRIRHAMFSPFVTRSDSGKRVPNYSSIGGDLAAAGLAHLYFPRTDRGVGLVFRKFRNRNRGTDWRRAGSGVHPWQIHQEGWSHAVTLAKRSSSKSRARVEAIYQFWQSHLNFPPLLLPFRPGPQGPGSSLSTGTLRKPFV